MEFAEFGTAFREPAATFGGLSTDERRTLAGWIATARNGGIDTVEDLGFRQWPRRGSETIIGVFKAGHLLASWLVVGHDGSWAVASCGDGAVSPRVPSLGAALGIVYPGQAPTPR